MPVKLTYEYVKKYIDINDELISKEYNNSKMKLEILCKKCNTIYLQRFETYRLGYKCKKCSVKIKTNSSKGGLQSCRKRYGEIFIKETIRICEICKKEYNPRRFGQKFCSKNCSAKNILHDKDTHRKNCSKGGIASAKSQQRRSKNEIAFAELCIEYFGKDNVLCNEPIFKDKNSNFWDCDIYLKHLKLAVLIDGFFWHYSEHASKKQKARDKIKRKVILNNNCKYYTIIDYGKYNKNFVQEQFDLFIHKLKYKPVIDDIIYKNNIIENIRILF